MSRRVLPWLPWTLVGLYVLLATPGLILQGLSQTYQPPWADLGFAGQIMVYIFAGTLSVIGALINSRYPRHPIGWLLWIVGFLPAVSAFCFGYAYYGLIADPGSLPGADVLVIWLIWGAEQLSILLFTFLLLLFPNGQFLPPRWRVVGWIGIGAVAAFLPLAALEPGPIRRFPFLTNPIAVSETVWPTLSPLLQIASTVGALCLLLALVSLILRLHRARGEERQQIKWFVYALSPLPVAIAFFALDQLEGGLEDRNLQLVLGIVLLTFIGTGLAIGTAILRYRLYDIDLIIRRTLIYSVLTGTLAVIYFASVVLLQNLFRIAAGAQSPLVIVLSTLLLAALFSPLRRRVQELIDRRFYRRKYDGRQVLARFAQTARDEVGLDELTTELVLVVDETMRPETMSLWLK